MEIRIEISDCPITGLKRMVEMQSFKWNKKEKRAVVECIIYLMKNDSIVDFGSKNIQLIASSEFMINTSNFETIPVYEYQNEEGFVNEYDFWEEIANSPINLINSIVDQMNLANLKGKFN